MLLLALWCDGSQSRIEGHEDNRATVSVRPLTPCMIVGGCDARHCLSYGQTKPEGCCHVLRRDDVAQKPGTPFSRQKSAPNGCEAGASRKKARPTPCSLLLLAWGLLGGGGQ